MVPCVVIATGRNQIADSDPDVQRFEEDFAPFLEGELSGTRGVELSEFTDEEGGNGGGGEAGTIHPMIGKYGRCFTGILHPQNVPPLADGKDEEEWKRRVEDARPRILRFELCLPFSDVYYARKWLEYHPAGQRLKRLFKYIVVAALSTPNFAGTDRPQEPSAVESTFVG